MDVVDNPFFPLVPGTVYTFEGGGEHVVVTVTHETKEILGVNTTVVQDQVTVDGALTERTLDWYAQDTAGNVWYIGEQTEEYEKGNVTSTEGTWEAGVHGAQPGIVMVAHPAPGDRYHQEWYEGQAEDLAKVFALDGSADVPAGSYTGVVVTEEWTPLQPGRHRAQVVCPGDRRRVRGADPGRHGDPEPDRHPDRAITDPRVHSPA